MRETEDGTLEFVVLLRDTPLDVLAEMKRDAHIRIDAGGKSWNDRLLVAIDIPESKEAWADFLYTRR